MNSFLLDEGLIGCSIRSCDQADCKAFRSELKVGEKAAKNRRKPRKTEIAFVTNCAALTTFCGGNEICITVSAKSRCEDDELSDIYCSGLIVWI